MKNLHSQELRNMSEVTCFLCGRTQIQTDLFLPNLVFLISHCFSLALMFMANSKGHYYNEDDGSKAKFEMVPLTIIPIMNKRAKELTF